jgi:hypothetical protein
MLFTLIYWTKTTILTDKEEVLRQKIYRLLTEQIVTIVQIFEIFSDW